MTGERRVAIHFPHDLDGTSTYSYDQQPDWYSATLPRLASPVDITGDQIYLVDTAPLIHDSIALPPIDTSSDWLSQVPPAEHCLVSDVSFLYDCDAETVLIQYLQLDCTVYVATDGGMKAANGSFSWVICSPGQEYQIRNSSPVDGWHR
jgi:hypothetical protein